MIIEILGITFLCLLIIYIILLKNENRNKNYTTKTPLNLCGDFLDIDKINSYLKLLYSNNIDDIIIVKKHIDNICPVLKNESELINNIDNIKNFLISFLTNLLIYKKEKTNDKIIKDFCNLCLNKDLKIIKN